MNPRRKSSTDPNPSISKLPAEVIAIILTFLPIKEAARTSILSTQWRHRWRSIPELVFDADFADIINPPTNQDRVMLKICQALMGHEGSSITMFELAIPGMSRCPELGQLIRYLSTKHVKELSLLLFHVRDFEETLQQLHSSLLSYFPDLTSLTLRGFEFVQPPWSVGFSKLAILDLENLILPFDFYEVFLPLCPLLQELWVVDDSFNHYKPVFSAPCLKVLFFHSSIESICFKYTPRLSVVSILDHSFFDFSDHHAFFRKNNPDMEALFAALPALEVLHIGFELLLFLSEGHVPYRLPVYLHNLKVLEAPRILLDRLSEVKVLLCLIRSSPNLRKLAIVHDDDDDHPVSNPIPSLQRLLEPEDGHLGMICCLQRLEEFSIKDCRGTRVEMDLVRFVLATAPELKRVFIEPKEDSKSDAMWKFTAELLQYTRISKEAKVEFLLTNVDQA